MAFGKGKAVGTEVSSGGAGAGAGEEGSARWVWKVLCLNRGVGIRGHTFVKTHQVFRKGDFYGTCTSINLTFKKDFQTKKIEVNIVQLQNYPACLPSGSNMEVPDCLLGIE